MSLIERAQKFDCATPDLYETAVHFHEAEAAGGKNRPRGSREREPVYVDCEPKDNGEVAHQKLPRNFAISFEARITQPRLRASVTKASRSVRIVRLETSHIGGKLAREVKAAHMYNLQAVLYLAKGARIMCTWNGWSINPKAPHWRS